MEWAAWLVERLIALAGSLRVGYNNKSAILLHGRGLTEGAAMPFRFDLLKTIQAVAVLMRREGPFRTTDYIRIIKLLYLADRECLKQAGRPITGDRVVAMKHGPVLSRVLNLVKGRDLANSQWGRYFETDRFQLRLLRDPGVSELSRFEIDLLEAVSDRHRELNQWQIVGLTHELPEWVKNDPGESSQRIPLEDILDGIGRRNDLDEIVREAEDRAAIADLVRGLE